MSLIRVMVMRCDGCGKTEQGGQLDPRYGARRFREMLAAKGWKIRGRNGQGAPEYCPDCAANPEKFEIKLEVAR